MYDSKDANEIAQPQVIIDNLSLRINQQDIKYALAFLWLGFCIFSSIFISFSFFLHFGIKLFTVLFFFILFKLSELSYNSIISKKVKVVFYPEEDLLLFQIGNNKQVVPVSSLKKVTGREANTFNNIIVQYTAKVLIDQTTYIFSTNTYKGKIALRNLERFCYKMQHRRWT